MSVGITRRSAMLVGWSLILATAATAQGPRQPKVAPGPSEPDWVVVLSERYGLSMFDDLLNPLTTTAAETRGLFRKAGPGPVSYTPVIALGLPSRTRGGWYRSAAAESPRKTGLWTYTFKNTTADLKQETNLPPPLESGSSVRFDPGDQPFGVWVANDGLPDGGVFSEPNVVARVNARLAAQPYKAMIYPNHDKATGKKIANSYIIGWEYSTNDDFQDVVCRLDNVILIDAAGKPGEAKP
ncbi:MAG: hypothetical protein P4L85_15650 [Paludisphaera borealis]|uniref:hypothetical protein n=1 Tax=Paludisphaera borealis TaxID=1387353 RepID=UPI002843537A|nr:hypothetical protein [Paludisphaera borealis]MDR3620786.1 hypothetical protein [Paludisphaera borealis]